MGWRWGEMLGEGRATTLSWGVRHVPHLPGPRPTPSATLPLPQVVALHQPCVVFLRNQAVVFKGLQYAQRGG